MYCPYCGAELPDDAVYCKDCGFELPAAASGSGSGSFGKSGDVQKDTGRSPDSSSLKSRSQPLPSTGSNKRTFRILLIVSVIVGIIIFAAVCAGFDWSDSSIGSTGDNRVPVMITSAPEGADVKIGANIYGKTPITIQLKQNTAYTIHLEKDGYYEVTKEITVGTEALTIKGVLTEDTRPHSATRTASPTPQPSVKPTAQKIVMPAVSPGEDQDRTQTFNKASPSAVADAIQPDDPFVQLLVYSAIKKEHEGPYSLEQVCDIYDYLYRNWKYVKDPEGGYFAPAGESAVRMKGDCDDFATLMASCVEAIGGDARVICAWNDTSGHAYAEALLDSDDEDYTNHVALSISERYHGATVNWHKTEDSSGTTYWLNLDWSAAHPGGKFFTSVGQVLVVYPDGHTKHINFTVEDGY